MTNILVKDKNFMIVKPMYCSNFIQDIGWTNVYQYVGYFNPSVFRVWVRGLKHRWVWVFWNFSLTTSYQSFRIIKFTVIEDLLTSALPTAGRIEKRYLMNFSSLLLGLCILYILCIICYIIYIIYTVWDII